MQADATLYVSQKAFISNGRELLLLNDPRFGLDFPGGKIQEGEADLAAALRREVREETGLEIEVGAAFTTWLDPIHPMFRRTGTPVLLIGYRCRLLGGRLRLSDEHDGYRWIEPAAFAEVDDRSTYAAALKAYFEADPA